ncbi:MAG: branched-chain amino acid aminotransferase/4-amino-4-deoxychorismate [Prolixibacteraceae bacterium]|nr:MAG: branched-chain amino acid aminotransferase/4-amino-4-deoxychorismate [Prolixibacteraceae bacterium]
MEYVILNGGILKKHETGFTPFFWNEPFVITQKMWFGFGGIPLFFENIETIKLVLNTINADVPDILHNEKELFRITKRMLNKNRFYRSGLITCQVYIGKTETNVVLTSVNFPGFDFPVSQHGIIVNYSEFEKYSANPLGPFTFSNEPIWKFADSRIRGTAFQNSIILNEKGFVCDCISANIFMVKGKTLITPSVETGCYTDTLRKYILNVAEKTGLNVVESDNIKKEEIYQMNEVFMASEEFGIQWIIGVLNKRFVHNYSRIIHGQINEFLKQKPK